MQGEKRWVLVLGGTNFMGKLLVEELVKNYSVCCINRGKRYWNNEARELNSEVQWFCSDRNEHKDYQATVKFAGRHLGISQNNKWAAVVDFCGFNWRDIQSSLKGVQDNCEKYIFISTDSIYNNILENALQPIREADIDLQKEYQKIKTIKEEKKDKFDLDNYGYNKMKCQIYLKRRCKIPYVCLRLPDVIGPYDNTDRFWATIKWLRQSEKWNVPITAQDQNLKLSLVDAESVVKMIIKLTGEPIVNSGSYNLCCWETCTICELLQIMKRCLKIDVKYKATKKGESKHFYPSVSCGRLSCEKASKQLGWKPLALGQAVSRSVEFFISKGNKYEQENKAAEKALRRKVQKYD